MSRFSSKSLYIYNLANLDYKRITVFQSYSIIILLILRDKDITTVFALTLILIFTESD